MSQCDFYIIQPVLMLNVSKKKRKVMLYFRNLQFLPFYYYFWKLYWAHSFHWPVDWFFWPAVHSHHNWSLVIKWNKSNVKPSFKPLWQHFAFPCCPFASYVPTTQSQSKAFRSREFHLKLNIKTTVRKRLSTSSVTWLALIAICSTVMSSILLGSCLAAPPVAPSSIFCGLKEGEELTAH